MAVELSGAGSEVGKQLDQVGQSMQEAWQSLQAGWAGANSQWEEQVQQGAAGFKQLTEEFVKAAEPRSSAGEGTEATAAAAPEASPPAAASQAQETEPQQQQAATAPATAKQEQQQEVAEKGSSSAHSRALEVLHEEVAAAAAAKAAELKRQAESTAQTGSSDLQATRAQLREQLQGGRHISFLSAPFALHGGNDNGGTGSAGGTADAANNDSAAPVGLGDKSPQEVLGEAREFQAKPSTSSTGGPSSTGGGSNGGSRAGSGGSGGGGNSGGGGSGSGGGGGGSNGNGDGEEPEGQPGYTAYQIVAAVVGVALAYIAVNDMPPLPQLRAKLRRARAPSQSET